MSKYHLISCHVLWRELSYFTAHSRNVFTFEFLRQGLHNTPDLLRQEVQQSIDALEKPEEEWCEPHDAVLLGYGLCSNGLMGITARDIPVVVVRAHDCITLLLGSRQRYKEYFDTHPGTYWYSPGWIDTNTQPGKDRYEKALEHYKGIYGEENAEYLMKMEQGWLHNYSTAAYVDLGFGDNEDYRSFTRQSAQWLGWDCDILEGEPDLLKDFVSGQWDDDRFLVVQPGEQIVPSHDERVIKAQAAGDKETE